MERTGVSLEFSEVTISDSQETVVSFEEIEGISEQRLIDGQHAQYTDQPATEDVCGYSSVIEHLVKQLPPTKRKLAEQQYDALKNRKGMLNILDD